jgi:hypothetical protein
VEVGDVVVGGTQNSITNINLSPRLHELGQIYQVQQTLGARMVQISTKNKEEGASNLKLPFLFLFICKKFKMIMF